MTRKILKKRLKVTLQGGHKMTTMSPPQARALEAVAMWQEELLPGTIERMRADIAGTMITTIIPLTEDQLARIDEIINE